jgi:histone H3/H4
LGVELVRRAFSLYDIEQFLKEEGDERVSENAVITLEKELEDMLVELVNEARVYANYAGRQNTITNSDLAFVAKSGGRRHIVAKSSAINHRKTRRRLSVYERYRGFPLKNHSTASALRPSASATNAASMSHI